MNVYPFIEAENAGGQGTVQRACVLLQVSRAAYYAHRARQAAGGSPRAQQDAVLTKRIITVHDRSHGTYGTPRIHAELAAQGHHHSRKRIARLLRASGRAGRSPQRYRRTTITDPAAGTRPDLINRNFTTSTTGIDTRWCGDITYLTTRQGWLYLATVIDLASRRVVGWATADHLRTDLPDQALRAAITHRQPRPGLIFHSDRGCQYTSAQFAHTAHTAGIRLSVGRRGECWDNAVAESFFATLKTELLHQQPWLTRQTAHHAIFNWIEGWYNTHRRHSTLGYLSPTHYENTHQPAHT